MMDAERLFKEIQNLPTEVQRALVDRVLRELRASPPHPPAPVAVAENPFLGLLSDEPDLADEILFVARKTRQEGREAFNGSEDAT